MLWSWEMEGVIPELTAKATASDERCVEDEPWLVPTISEPFCGTSAARTSAFRAGKTDEIVCTYLYPSLPSAFPYAAHFCCCWRQGKESAFASSQPSSHCRFSRRRRHLLKDGCWFY